MSRIDTEWGPPDYTHAAAETLNEDSGIWRRPPLQAPSVDRARRGRYRCRAEIGVRDRIRGRNPCPFIFFGAGLMERVDRVRHGPNEVGPRRIGIGPRYDRPRPEPARPVRSRPPPAGPPAIAGRSAWPRRRASSPRRHRRAPTGWALTTRIGSRCLRAALSPAVPSAPSQLNLGVEGRGPGRLAEVSTEGQPQLLAVTEH
jgi:hypothetical protein